VRTRAAALLVTLVLVAVAAFWWARGGDAEGARPATASALAAPGPVAGARSTTPTAPGPAPSRQIRRLTAEQRQVVAAQIAAARAAREARDASAPAAADGSVGSAAERKLTVERVSSPVKSALEESIPILAECYARTGQRPARAAVMMSLVGDPAVGTLVDPSEMVDADRKPLAPELDRCLRETFLSLELPPLDEGDKLDIQYSFDFDD